MEKKWYFGIDVSKETLDSTVYRTDAKNLQKDVLRVSNDKSGFKELLKWLKGFSKELSELVICLEHTGYYAVALCEWLEKNEIDYTLLVPLHLKLSMGLVRGKNDQVDAIRIARHGYLHREELKYSKLPDKELQQLKYLMNEREQTVKELTKLKGMEDGIKRATDHSYKRHQRRLKELERDLEEIEQDIKTIIDSADMLKDNYRLLTSIKGVGFVNAVATIIATRNFTIFDDPRKYACYVGVAPFPHSSGSSVRGSTRVSRYSNKQLKVLLTQAARSAIQHDKQLKAYYEKKTAEGKAYGVILNAVKYKIVLRMFSVINRREEYVDSLEYKNATQQK